jgi:hypothetical protein
MTPKPDPIALATLSEHLGVPLPTIEKWFDSFTKLHTDLGLNPEAAYNASHHRGIKMLCEAAQILDSIHGPKDSILYIALWLGGCIPNIAKDTSTPIEDIHAAFDHALTQSIIHHRDSPLAGKRL